MVILRRPYDVEQFRGHELVDGGMDDADVGIRGRNRHDRKRLVLEEMIQLGRLEGVDMARRSDGLGKDAGEVAAARNQIHDARARLDTCKGEHFGRLAVRIALGVGLGPGGIADGGLDVRRDRRGSGAGPQHDRREGGQYQIALHDSSRVAVMPQYGTERRDVSK